MGIFNPFSNLSALKEGWENLTGFVTGAFGVKEDPEQPGQILPEPGNKDENANVVKDWNDKVEDTVISDVESVKDTVVESKDTVVEWVDTTIIEPSKEAIQDAGDWANDKIVRPTISFIKDAGDWANDNIKNPISKTWDKWKVPILAGAGAVVAIKILK